MRHITSWPVAAALLAVLAACEPQPAEDLATPVDKYETNIAFPGGNVEAGREAFLALGCNSCHRVEGAADLPKPSASPEVPVVLGGKHTAAKSQAELMTAIVNPSHELAKGQVPAAVATGGKSRMGDYARVMTVEQLVNVVAFLRSTEMTTSAMAR
jgi:hypothetical protein